MNQKKKIFFFGQLKNFGLGNFLENFSEFFFFFSEFFLAFLEFFFFQFFWHCPNVTLAIFCVARFIFSNFHQRIVFFCLNIFCVLSKCHFQILCIAHPSSRPSSRPSVVRPLAAGSQNWFSGFFCKSVKMFYGLICLDVFFLFKSFLAIWLPFYDKNWLFWPNFQL